MLFHICAMSWWDGIACVHLPLPQGCVERTRSFEVIDEDLFRRLERRAARKLARALGLATPKELSGVVVSEDGLRFRGLVMQPELGGLVVWCLDDGGIPLPKSWLSVMREIHAMHENHDVQAPDNGDVAEVMSEDANPVPSAWSDYYSSEEAMRILGVEQLELHRLLWAPTVDWLRCKELYGASSGIIYHWSIRCDRVLGAEDEEDGDGEA